MNPTTTTTSPSATSMQNDNARIINNRIHERLNRIHIYKNNKRGGRGIIANKRVNYNNNNVITGASQKNVATKKLFKLKPKPTVRATATATATSSKWTEMILKEKMESGGDDTNKKRSSLMMINKQLQQMKEKTNDDSNSNSYNNNENVISTTTRSPIITAKKISTATTIPVEPNKSLIRNKDQERRSQSQTVTSASVRNNDLKKFPKKKRLSTIKQEEQLNSIRMLNKKLQDRYNDRKKRSSINNDDTTSTTSNTLREVCYDLNSNSNYFDDSSNRETTSEQFINASPRRESVTRPMRKIISSTSSNGSCFKSMKGKIRYLSSQKHQ